MTFSSHFNSKRIDETANHIYFKLPEFLKATKLRVLQRLQKIIIFPFIFLNRFEKVSKKGLMLFQV